MTLHLYNTLTRKKEAFAPLDPAHVKMYVCGPTVYDSPHLGNARSVVVYDVLYRLLKQLYPQVTYVRNITDVDDKINAAAKERGISIQALTAEVTAGFHADMDALNVLRPDVEPRATEHIPQMIAIIQSLIQHGNAYESQGHVLFDVMSRSQNAHWKYGMLSGRVQEELKAGARIEVEGYKRHAGDFVLWKPADAQDDPSSVFESPWGRGRPGWHIECSAMSTNYLGETFDLHGGGADLMFPHHENEIAQSCCAFPGSEFAKYWVHNGFLTVNGEKMSKSLGNFMTVRELLDKGVKGEVIRFALLSTHYRKPLDWTEKLLDDSKKALEKFAGVIFQDVMPLHPKEHQEEWVTWENSYYSFIEEGKTFNLSQKALALYQSFFEALHDDMNSSVAFSRIHEMSAFDGDYELPAHEYYSYKAALYKALNIIGISIHNYQNSRFLIVDELKEQIETKINARIAAKKAKNWAEADRIRDDLKAQGILLEDRPDGTTDWRRG